MKNVNPSHLIQTASVLNSDMTVEYKALERSTFVSVFPRITQLPSVSDFVSLENLDLRFNCMSGNRLSSFNRLYQSNILIVNADQLCM